MRKLILESIHDQLMRRNKELVEKFFNRYLNKEVKIKLHYTYGQILLGVIIEGIDVFLIKYTEDRYKIELQLDAYTRQTKVYFTNTTEIYDLDMSNYNNTKIITEAITNFFYEKIETYTSLTKKIISIQTHIY